MVWQTIAGHHAHTHRFELDKDKHDLATFIHSGMVIHNRRCSHKQLKPCVYAAVGGISLQGPAAVS